MMSFLAMIFIGFAAGFLRFAVFAVQHDTMKMSDLSTPLRRLR
jgi:hypothetical protein